MTESTDGHDGGATPTPEGNDALTTIARLEDARRIPRGVMEKLLGDPDVVVRRRMLLALGRLGRAESLGPLRSALTDTDTATQEIALFGLGQLDGAAQSDGEQVLRHFLSLSPRPAARRRALLALGRVGSPDSAALLLEALESPDPGVRTAAARAFGHYASRGQQATAEELVALASHLRDQEVTVRRAAAFALSRQDRASEQVAPTLAQGLTPLLGNEGDAETRIQVARAMAALDVGQPGALLRAIKNDSDWRVRTAAAVALGKRAAATHQAKAISLAWQQASAPLEQVNSTAMHALMALVDAAVQRPAPQLTKSLAAVRREVQSHLAQTKDRDIRHTLAYVDCHLALAQDASQRRPNKIAHCGGPTGRQGEDQAAGAEAEEPSQLVPSWQRRAWTARAWTGATRPVAVRRLATLLGDDDARVRVAAIAALGSLDLHQRLPLLEKALADESPHVVASAAEELRRAAPAYGTAPAKQSRMTVVEHTKEGSVTHTLAAEESGPPSRTFPAQALARALKARSGNEDLEALITLLQAAGPLKATAAAAQVTLWANHHNVTVRRAARKALTDLGQATPPELPLDPPNVVDGRTLTLPAEPQVALVTTKGEVTLQLRPDHAPATSANFLALVRRGWFKNVAFHRVVPGFVVQSGDQSGTGYGAPEHNIRCELSEAPFTRGSVGMALAGRDTGGSQFFVTMSEQPHLNRRYALFARVREGQEVIEALQPWDRILSARQVAP
jgi:cyclophilin family peptidyl-prolyl cis-trans isomerase/HEAT repeat protein